MDGLNDIQADARQAETYRQMGSYDQALEIFNQIIDKCPTYAWAWAHRGATYLEKGRKEHSDQYLNKALQDLSEAIKRSPQYAWAFAYRGETHRQKALHAYRESRSSQDTEVKVRTQSECAQAVEDLTQATTLKDDYTWAWAHLGAAYLQFWREDENVSHLDEAIAKFTKAIDLTPDQLVDDGYDYPWAWAYRGVAHYLRASVSNPSTQADDYREACDDILKGISLDPLIFGKQVHTLHGHLTELIVKAKQSN